MTPSLLDLHGSPTAATMFLLVHRALRRDLARFPQAVRLLPEDDRAQAERIVDHWRRVRGALDEHQAAEDDQLFGVLLAAEPALSDVLAVLGTQHAALDGALAAIEAALAELPGAAASRAADLLSAFATDLDGHLALEEEHLVGVMLRLPEPAAGVGGGAGAGARADRGWLLAWGTEDLDPATLGAVLSRMPPDVAERAPAVRRDHETAVRAVWRDLPCAGEQVPSRPIGWWLREADARLDAAFDRGLRGRDTDRRGWQVLASLAGRPAARADLVAALGAFDRAPAAEAVVDDLRSRGWIEEWGGLLRLTRDGEREQLELAAIVDAVRGQVAAALPHGDYPTLVRLLEQLVAGL